MADGNRPRTFNQMPAGPEWVVPNAGADAPGSRSTSSVVRAILDDVINAPSTPDSPFNLLGEASDRHAQPGGGDLLTAIMLVADVLPIFGGGQTHDGRPLTDAQWLLHPGDPPPSPSLQDAAIFVRLSLDAVPPEAVPPEAVPPEVAHPALPTIPPQPGRSAVSPPGVMTQQISGRGYYLTDGTRVMDDGTRVRVIDYGTRVMD